MVPGTPQDSPCLCRADDDGQALQQMPHRGVGVTAGLTRDSFCKLSQGLETLGAPAARGLSHHRNEEDPLLGAFSFRIQVGPLKSFISGRGRAGLQGGLGHDILPLRRNNRKVKCSRGTVDPRREVDVRRAAEVGASGIVWAWR
jgi:hypothetical protein